MGQNLKWAIFYSLIWLKSDLGGAIVVQLWTSQIVPVVGIQ